jgi:hypothetical protein
MAEKEKDRREMPVGKRLAGNVCRKMNSREMTGR